MNNTIIRNEDQNDPEKTGRISEVSKNSYPSGPKHIKRSIREIHYWIFKDFHAARWIGGDAYGTITSD